MSTRGRNSADRDGGVAVIEAAIVSLVFFTIVLGTFEFGLVYRDYLSIGDAAGGSARTGSVVGKKITADGTNADYQIIRAIRDATSGIDPGDIDVIVVFKGSPGSAGSPTSQVPTSCKNGTAQTNRCNVYDPTDAFLQVQDGNAEYFDCDANAESPSCPWPPSSRQDGPTPSDVEYVGVYIKVTKPLITGFFGSAFTLEEATIARLEPGPFSAE